MADVLSTLTPEQLLYDQRRDARIKSAEQIARRNATGVFAENGLTAHQYQPYLDEIQRMIGDTEKTLGYHDDPYTVLNGKDIGTQVFNTAQNTARSTYSHDVDKQVGANYGDNLINDHLLDGVISDILGKQSTSAQDYLDRGQARGIYNDVGYSAGTKALQDQASAGKSQLGSLANDVLSKYETQGNTVRDKAYSAANSFTLGNNFNLDDYLSQGNKIADNAQEYGAGDLRTALGGTNYFDFSGLSNAAGAAQGAVNLRDSSIPAVLAERQKAKYANRGLGSQGVF